MQLVTETPFYGKRRYVLLLKLLMIRMSIDIMILSSLQKLKKNGGKI